MTDNMGSPLCEQLTAIVGSAGFLEGEDIERKNFKDWMGARAIGPPLLLRPHSTSQVSQILALCPAEKQPIAPQGGMTGLVSAAAPLEGEIALSLERMKSVIEVDPVTATMTVEAGVELQTI